MASTLSTAKPSADSSFIVGLKYRLPARYLISWVALIVVGSLITVLAPETFSGRSLVVVTALAGALLVASLGLLLVVMQGAIDLSIGAYMTLAAAVNVHYLADLGPAKSFGAAILLCVVVSTVSGALITIFRLNALIVTLAVNTVIMAAIPLWMGQQFANVAQAPEWLQSIALKNVFNISGILYVALVISFLTAAVLAFTRVGRRYVATGTNPRASRMLGLNATGLAIGGFSVAGLLYGIAGSLVAGLVQTPGRDLGAAYMLTTVVAVALAGALFTGGPASVFSLIAACLVLQFLDQALAIEQLSQGARSIVQGGILIAAVALSAILQYGRDGWSRFRSLASGPARASGEG